MAKVARQMTPEQISHGQKLSNELDKKQTQCWKRKNYALRALPHAKGPAAYG